MPVDLFIRRNVIVGPTEPNKKEMLSVARCLIEEGLALPIRGCVYFVKLKSLIFIYVLFKLIKV